MLWRPEVFADLWKLGGENHSDKASSHQSGDQMKRRCFHELQTSALATAASRGLCTLPRTGKAASAAFLNIPASRLP